MREMILKLLSPLNTEKFQTNISDTVNNLSIYFLLGVYFLHF